MNSDLKLEEILSRVRDELRRNGINLWTQPYYDDVLGVKENEEQALMLLSEMITEKLNINQSDVLSALTELQTRALNRLKANEVFKETGVACLKVKVTGEASTSLTIDIPLKSNTSELIEAISSRVGTPIERIKLISMGKVLKSSASLESQGLKNGSQLMAVTLTDDGTKIQEAEKRLKILENTKKDVKLLEGSSNLTNDYYLQIENQSGETLNLPYHERKSLVTAMALHEKGRVALKKEDYPMALVLFLEADKEYSECTSQLLNTVDNYALLHLDIAWCYLCLRNPTQIPDAERRLHLCEQNFHKTYGPNLERLMAIKGTTGNEMALFMRLHLLQGVVYFHKNNRVEAKKLFERAMSELKELKVDDNSVTLLMELGFTSAEARLGLRATHGNIEEAEELIARKRKERELAREKNLEKLQLQREQKLLGLCADKKQFCDPRHVKKLVDMGFSHRQSVEAIKLSNNVISEAISIIQDRPQLLPTSSVSEESMAKLASLGFEPDVAREALEKFPDLERAVKSLTSLLDTGPSTSAANGLTTSASALSFLEHLQKKRKAQREEEQNAFGRLSEGIRDNDLTEDHLDFKLDQEEQFLVEYMSLLE